MFGVIADKAAPCGRASGIEPLAAAGVPIWIDDRARLARPRTMVVNGKASDLFEASMRDHGYDGIPQTLVAGPCCEGSFVIASK